MYFFVDGDASRIIIDHSVGSNEYPQEHSSANVVFMENGQVYLVDSNSKIIYKIIRNDNGDVFLVTGLADDFDSETGDGINGAHITTEELSTLRGHT